MALALPELMLDHAAYPGDMLLRVPVRRRSWAMQVGFRD